MSDPIWKPNTTVAVVLEHAGRYLLVEEETDDGLRFNQPAGHLDHGESLLQACVREAREETGYVVRPTALVGIYQWSPPARPGLSYLRFAYAADLASELERPAGVTLLNLTIAAELAAEAQPAGATIQNLAWSTELAEGVIGAQLDAGIVRAVWLSYAEVRACQDRHRSPLVLQCIDDYRAGRRYPLELIRHYD